MKKSKGGAEKAKNIARKKEKGERVTVVIIDEEPAPDGSDRLARDRRRLRRLVRSALRGEDLRGARTVTVLITGDQRISDLCARFLGRARRTDVLAFPGEDEELGEVVVNADRARREARRRNIDPVAELYLYVVHGLLHLVGYDDLTPEEAERMHQREEQILRRFGYRAVFRAPVLDRQAEGSSRKRGGR